MRCSVVPIPEEATFRNNRPLMSLSVLTTIVRFGISWQSLRRVARVKLTATHIQYLRLKCAG